MRSSLAPWLTCLALSPALSAQTQLYGEANIYSQAVLIPDTTAVELTGELSHLGFRHQSSFDEARTVTFDLKTGFDWLAGTALVVQRGEVAMTGDTGTLGVRYGETALSASNAWLQLSDNDPLSWRGFLLPASSSNLSLPTGVEAAEGFFYQSPILGEQIAIGVSVLPAEFSGGDAGLSLAVASEASQLSYFAGFEVNGAYQQSAWARALVEAKLDKLSVGGGLQWMNQAMTDVSALALMSWFKNAENSSPWQWMGRVSWSQRQGGSTEQSVYLSGLAERRLSDKAAAYGFTEFWVNDDESNWVTYVGGGFRLSF